MIVRPSPDIKELGLSPLCLDLNRILQLCACGVEVRPRSGPKYRSGLPMILNLSEEEYCVHRGRKRKGYEAGKQHPAKRKTIMQVVISSNIWAE